MNISNSYFFVSLFNPEASGTVLIKFKRIKIECHVKHSINDWKDVPLTLGQVENFRDKTVIFNWIPVGWRCQGIRINIFFYKKDIE